MRQQLWLGCCWGGGGCRFLLFVFACVLSLFCPLEPSVAHVESIIGAWVEKKHLQSKSITRGQTGMEQDSHLLTANSAFSKAGHRPVNGQTHSNPIFPQKWPWTRHWLSLGRVGWQNWKNIENNVVASLSLERWWEWVDSEKQRNLSKNSTKDKKQI